MSVEYKKIILKNFLINYISSVGSIDKPSIIFLHGWRSESSIWLDLINKFSTKGYNSYALDLPGFGKSKISKNALTNSDYCEIVEEFITKQKINKVILIGHSNGGAISIKLASNNPEYLQKLVLISSAGIRQKTSEIKTKNIIAKLVKPLFMLSFMRPLRRTIYKAIGGEDYTESGSNTQTYLNIISEDLTETLDLIAKPTLLIWGTDDTATPLAFGKIMHSDIKNSIMETFEGDHFVFLKENERIFTSILNFIEK